MVKKTADARRCSLDHLGSSSPSARPPVHVEPGLGDSARGSGADFYEIRPSNSSRNLDIIEMNTRRVRGTKGGFAVEAAAEAAALGAAAAAAADAGSPGLSKRILGGGRRAVFGRTRQDSIFDKLARGTWQSTRWKGRNKRRQRRVVDRKGVYAQSGGKINIVRKGPDWLSRFHLVMKEDFFHTILSARVDVIFAYGILLYLALVFVFAGFYYWMNDRKAHCLCCHFAFSSSVFSHERGTRPPKTVIHH